LARAESIPRDHPAENEPLGTSDVQPNRIVAPKKMDDQTHHAFEAIEGVMVFFLCVAVSAGFPQCGTDSTMQD
jgi:hypothetical protein